MAILSAHHRLSAEGRVRGRIPLGAELKNTLRRGNLFLQPAALAVKVLHPELPHPNFPSEL